MYTTAIICFVLCLGFQGWYEWKFRNDVTKQLNNIHTLIFSANSAFKKNVGCSVEVDKVKKTLKYTAPTVEELKQLIRWARK